MRLIFEQGKFILKNAAGKIAVPPDFDSHYGLDLYTENPQAAVSFRRYADEKTERLFKKLFVQFYDAPTLPQLAFLDPHQVSGINWILTRSRSYLAHAPGAGKTLQAIIASILTKGEGQTLFIVPPTLTVNWAREILRWTEWTGLWPTVSIVPTSDGQDAHSWRAEFIICPDSMLTKDWVLTNLLKLKKKFVAVDEASRFKESESARSIALFGGHTDDFKSPGLVHSSKHSVLMDGSPMPNRPMELWAPTYAMSPESIDFMPKEKFGFKYCGATMDDRGRWQFKNSSREDELHDRLQKNFMHVVTEDSLGHPERRRSIVPMSGDPRSAKMKAWEMSVVKELSLDNIDEELSRGEIAAYRQELGISKVPWIAEYIKFRLEKPNEAILLFVWHREVAFLLAERLKAFNPGLVVGGSNPIERENFFGEFQEGKRPLGIGNIRAMGVGHNLQRSTRVVFGEYSFTNEYNLQCEKRASRKNSSLLFIPCDYIVAPGTFDEPTLKAVFTKEKRVKRIIG